MGGNGGQWQRTRMGNNQLTGINSNPMHVLSAGAGDLLANHQSNSSQLSPSYQNIGSFA